MNQGRPTTDPKGESIRIRLNEEMKQWIFRKSLKDGITVSQIIRDLVDAEMKSER